MVSIFKREKCVTKLHKIIFTISVAAASLASQAQEITSESFFKKLKTHYQTTNMIDDFSISYKSTSYFGPQSYDYKKPTKTFNRKVIDVDVKNKSYFLHNTRGGFPGGHARATKEFNSSMRQGQINLVEKIDYFNG